MSVVFSFRGSLQGWRWSWGAYLEVKVRLGEVLVQGGGQVLHRGDYDAAGRGQGLVELTDLQWHLTA